MASNPDTARILLTAYWSKYKNTLFTIYKLPQLSKSWLDLMKWIANDDFSDYLSVQDSVDWIRELLIWNGIDELEFLSTLLAVIDRQAIKRNCVVLMGPPNCGKTLLANSICRSLTFFANVQDFNKYNNFYLQDCLNQRICLANEPSIDSSKFETIKNIFEGQAVSIAVKYEKHANLERTPWIVTTNHPLAHLTLSPTENEYALMARCHLYHMRYMPALAQCQGQLHPLAWYTLLKDQQLV